MAVETVDVLVLSASRPHLLWMTLHSFNTHATGVRLRFFIDDDVVDQKLSAKITRKNLMRNAPVGVTPLNIADIRFEKHPIGPFRKYHRFARSPTRDRHMFILEDDWTLPSPVDFAALVAALDANPMVSQLMLPFKVYPVAPPETLAGGLEVVLNKQPHASPALWRTDVLRASAEHPVVGRMIERGNFREFRMPSLFPDFYVTIKELSGDSLEEYLRRNIGAFALKSKHAMVVHIGCCWKRFKGLGDRRRSVDDIKNLTHELLSARNFIMLDPTAPIPLIPLHGVIPAAEHTTVDGEIAKVREACPRRFHAYLRRLLAQFDAFADPGRDELRKHLEINLTQAAEIPYRFEPELVRPLIPSDLVPDE